MCQRGALGSRLDLLTAGSGGALGGNGIIGRLGVAMSGVGWYDGLGITGDGEP